MATKRRKKRVPKLTYTRLRNIGWHVSFRDADTGMPRRHRFGMVSREEAEAAFHEWVATHLRNETVVVKHRVGRRKLDEQLKVPEPKGVPAEIVAGSLLEITSGLLIHDESRVSDEAGTRRRGTMYPEDF